MKTSWDRPTRHTNWFLAFNRSIVTRVRDASTVQSYKILIMRLENYAAPLAADGKVRAIGSATTVLPIAALALLMPWLIKIDSTLQAVLLCIQLALCAWGIGASFSRGLRPVALVYYSFSFAWLGIGPTYQLATEQIPWNDRQLLAQPQDIAVALAITALATLMFTIGSLVQSRRTAPEKKIVKITVRLPVTWLLIVAAVALFPFVIQSAGGISGLFANRGDRTEALLQAGISVSQSGGVQLALAKILPAALAMAASFTSVVRFRQSWLDRGFARIKGSEAAAVLVSLVLLVLYCNPFISSRFLSVLAFGPLIMAAIQPRSVFAGKIFATIALLGTSIVYPLANIFRDGFDSRTAYKTGLDAFAGMDFDGFQQVVNSLAFVRDFGHSVGQYTISAFLYFVPRSVWEGKATPASLDVAENRGYLFTDLSLPLHAEMYIEFGVFGMALLMLAFGWFCSKTDSMWKNSSGGRMGVLAPMLSMAMLGLLRGPLGSLAPIYLTALGLAFAALSCSPVASVPSKSRQ